MDRNTVIGYILIFGIIFGFYWYTTPTEQELKLQQIAKDSLTQVVKQTELKKIAQQQFQQAQQVADESQHDSTAVNTALIQQFGDFAQAAVPSANTYVLENELLKATIASKGGRIVGLQLKTHKTDLGKAVELINKDSSNFNISFVSNGKTINTNELYFTASSANVQVKGNDSSQITIKLNVSKDKFIAYTYSLKGNSYLVGFNIQVEGLQNTITNNGKGLQVNWETNLIDQEKSMENQRNASSVYYYDVTENEVDYFSERKDEKETFEAPLKWIAFRQQFFTQTLIASKPIQAGATLETATNTGSVNFVKTCKANFTLPYTHKASETIALSYFFGPTHFNTLKAYGNKLEEQVPLGFFGFINRWVVIPVFNFLEGFNLNYGIIILLLTIFIKLILWPLTYKAFQSQAKMKVLKPEMDELAKKYPKQEDAMAKQQAVMSMYRKAGVNPFGGCLPMLLQMPILLSMFRFFPASFELRQQSFLWADDLSTYDSVYNIGYNIPFYGDHISLFTILMTVSTILYTRMNSSSFAGDSSNPQMQSIKYMMYIMPVIFMFVFNSYSSGLSYYYFVANMLTFGIQYAMRFMVNENSIREKIEENKSKPVKQSAWEQKISEMAKKRGIQMPPKK